MTGSSVHFKPVKSAQSAVLHASRTVSPSYLLAPEHSLGTINIVDDCGGVASTLEKKLSLASPQAKAKKDFSPIWEGVLNLRRPGEGEDKKAYRKECFETVKQWCDAYEKMSGHRVLRADVHLDEGHMENGKALLNAHAHVIADRTDENGRVKRLLAPDLRKLQTITATVTKLERGANSLQTGRKHLAHQAYRHLAEQGRLETQKVEELLREKIEDNNNWRLYSADLPRLYNENKKHKAEAVALKNELEQLKSGYAQERKALIASGEATQKNYQELKRQYDAKVKEAKEAAAGEIQALARAERAEKALDEKQALLEETLEMIGALEEVHDGLRDELDELKRQPSSSQAPAEVEDAEEPAKGPTFGM